MKPAIIYLAQNTPRDRQYGRDSRSLLEKSLDLLYRNYNQRFAHDVIIFHEGDFTPEDQDVVRRGRKEIRFRQVDFEIPEFLPAAEVPEVWTSLDHTRYPLGHRHMIRFYAVRIFRILADLGYDWFFRLDDDSFIHSSIDYDIFKFMEQRGYEYGYRVDVRDAETCARGFGEAVWAYLRAEGIEPTFLWERQEPAPYGVQLKNIVKTALKRAFPRGRWRITPSFSYDLWGYYNNFFVTKIAFWLRPDVQAFIGHFDRMGAWYKYRWNDLIFQSAAVQIFMPKDHVYKFTDWTYEHATLKQGRLAWGGIYRGTADRDASAVRLFREAHGATTVPPERSY